MFPYVEMQRIMQKHWSEMMEELDEHINTDNLEIKMRLKYENEWGEGFEVWLEEPKEV